MTTPAAARLYEALHLYEHEGKQCVVFNPKNRPIGDLPCIFGFNNGGSAGWLSAIAIAEDGTCLGSHVCSSEAYMPADLGVIEGTKPGRHKDDYQPHYPDGYRMEFVPSDKCEGHKKLKEAIRINIERQENDANR